MLKLRRVNIEGLLETGVVELKEVDEQMQFWTNPNFFGMEQELTLESLIMFCEIVAAQLNVVFDFRFNSQQPHPWYGGIYKWRPPLKIPTDPEEIEKFNAQNVPIYKLEGPWLAAEPDLIVDDKDMPNLFCQLLTAMLELFSDEERNMEDVS